MQASIAHDLRNPIAIIEGYTEYLQMNLPAGKISPEKAERIAGNLNLAAKRLEQYTESVRELNQLEDMEIHREEIPVRKLVESIREDLEVMAAGAGIALHVTCALPESGLEQEGSPKARSNGGRPDAGGKADGRMPRKRQSPKPVPIAAALTRAVEDRKPRRKQAPRPTETGLETQTGIRRRQ